MQNSLKQTDVLANVEREATLKAAMEAGCSEAERLGYGSELGYIEASAISERAASVALDQLVGAVSLLNEASLYVANVADHPPATELLGRIDAFLASGGQ